MLILNFNSFFIFKLILSNVFKRYPNFSLFIKFFNIIPLFLVEFPINLKDLILQLLGYLCIPLSVFKTIFPKSYYFREVKD
jgi:hypothetical protein